MATSFTARPDGGEQAISSVGTTWAEVRLPLRTRRVTVNFSGVSGYLGRGQTEGGAVTGHSGVVADSPFEIVLGPPSYAELGLGYRPINIAVSTGTANVFVRSEVL